MKRSFLNPALYNVAGTLHVPSASYEIRGYGIRSMPATEPPAESSRRQFRSQRSVTAYGVCLLHGFTLIEILVVLVIVSLIAATAVLSSTGIWRQASLEASITRLEALDQHMRIHARSQGKGCAIEFDTHRQCVRKLYESDKRPDQPTASLGRGFTLERVHVAAGRQSRRKTTIPFNSAGMTPTYALGFRTADKQPFWLLFAGVGGQMTRFDSEKELNAALQLINP